MQGSGREMRAVLESLAMGSSASQLRVIGVAGHRRFADPATGRFVQRGCHAILRRIGQASPGCVAMSPLAEGADTLFAEAAVGLGLPLDVVRPYATFGEDFSTASARRRYGRLRSAARRHHDLAFHEPCDAAFEAAMNRVVEHCDLLVVAWDGGSPGGHGGTAHAVRRAIDLGRPWIHLDTLQAEVHVHGLT
jgi:hypothetical protein